MQRKSKNDVNCYFLVPLFKTFLLSHFALSLNFLLFKFVDFTSVYFFAG